MDKEIKEDRKVLNVPEHIKNVANILKYNQGIRIETSKCIQNMLRENGVIPKDGSSYVKFMNTKFAVIANGLSTEFRYTEPFFVSALVQGIVNFSDNCKNIIREHCDKEKIKYNGQE